jgi:hypothetical protein
MEKYTDRTPPSSGVRSFFKKPVIILFLFLLIAVLVLRHYSSQLLLVLLPENGVAVTFPVSPGDEWVYHYKHSVQLTPCYEYFRINGPDDMVMTRTVYESYGVGLPYSPSEGQFTSLKEEGKFELTMNRPYKTVSFRPAIQAKPDITCHGVTYDLCHQFGQGTRVDVRVMKRYKFWLLK